MGNFPGNSGQSSESSSLTGEVGGGFGLLGERIIAERFVHMIYVLVGVIRKLP